MATLLNEVTTAEQLEAVDISGKVVFSQDTGFRIASDPATVRAPDAAFVNSLRAREITCRGYATVVPNLVVEVLSTDDRPAQVLEKLADWLDVGACLRGCWTPCAARCAFTAPTGAWPFLTRAARSTGRTCSPASPARWPSFSTEPAKGSAVASRARAAGR